MMRNFYNEHFNHSGRIKCFVQGEFNGGGVLKKNKFKTFEYN